MRGRLALLGPGFVAAVAYVDPGNFVVNFQGGAQEGYLLIWAIVAANLLAVLIQYLSAKLGMVSGRNLPEACRAQFPRGISIILWIQAEVVVMATDLAEFVGSAIALHLLFGCSMTTSALATAAVSWGLLALTRRGHRRFEAATCVLLAVVAAGFVYDVAAVGHCSAPGLLAGMVPRLRGRRSLVLCIGVLGATVMPHVIYLHSALTQRRVVPRDDAERHRLLAYIRIDCGAGLGIAGLLNVLMLIVAADTAARTGRPVGTLASAYRALADTIGAGAALMFCGALLASGLSSSSVGTYAGEVVMQGFTGRRVPTALRRSVTMLPSLVVLVLGLPADTILLLSQVILSFGIPFALVPLILLTRRSDLLGVFANRRSTTLAASVIAVLVVVLNGYLLCELAGM